MALLQLARTELSLAAHHHIHHEEPHALTSSRRGKPSTPFVLVHEPHAKIFTPPLVYNEAKLQIAQNGNILISYIDAGSTKGYLDDSSLNSYNVSDDVHFEVETRAGWSVEEVETGTACCFIHESIRSDREGVQSEVVDFVCLLQRCIKVGDLAEGRRLHCLIISSGLEYDSSLGAPLIRMYDFFGRLTEAQQVFSKSLFPNVFTWSAIISAHSKSWQTEEALMLYWWMRASAVEPDGHAFVAALQVCSFAADVSQGRTIHSHVIESGCESDVYISSTIIDMYSVCGCVFDARAVFNRFPTRNVVTWSALIKGYTQLDCGKEALQLYHQMEQQGVDADEITFVCILKACSSLAPREAQQMHAHIIEMGFEASIWVSKALVGMYASSDNVTAMQVMFERMQEQGVVAYGALISGYNQCNNGQQVLCAYDHLLKNGLEPDVVIYVCTVRACISTSDLEFGHCVHKDIVGRGVEANAELGSTLIDLYAKCGSLVDAHIEFLRLPSPNIVIWNALITGYSQQECDQEVLQLFVQLQEEGVQPDSITLSLVLRACCSCASLGESRRVHIGIVKRGLDLDRVVSNVLIDVYVKQGSFSEACMIFCGISERNVVTYSSMIDGYAQHGLCHHAIQTFDYMQMENIRPDPVAFACVLKACCSTSGLQQGIKLHSQIVSNGWEADTFLGSILVDMYAKGGSIEDACRIFSRLTDRSVVTWNALIACYSEHEDYQEALKLHKRMQLEGVESNLVTFLYSLKACSSIAALEQGRQIHGSIINRGYEMDIMVGSTLINMYAKCGSLEEAHNLSDRLQHRNQVTWSALMAGYAQHCNYQSALECFLGMIEEGHKPDDVTFLCLLLACSHNADLLERGCVHFKSMRDEYQILPGIEHCNTMLHLLGRAGLLNQAEDMLETSPWRGNIFGWTSLLTSCRRHASLDLGRRCFDWISSVDAENTAPHVLMAGMYAEAGMHEDAKTIEEIRMHSYGWKKPAKSFIEIGQEVHSFTVGDKVHARSIDILAKLTSLTSNMKNEGSQPLLDMVPNAKLDEHKATVLCSHSEKLAIAFGLISTAEGTTIRVSKNLKMCADCHKVAKFVSKVEMREIIVADAYCVHRFQDGDCTCNDSF